MAEDAGGKNCGEGDGGGIGKQMAVVARQRQDGNNGETSENCGDGDMVAFGARMVPMVALL